MVPLALPRSPVSVCPGLLAALAVAVTACAPTAPAPLRPPHAPISHAEQPLRPTDTTSGLLWRYEPTDVVEHYDSPDGGFRVHFTRSGVNAVPDAGAELLPDGGLGAPALVRAVADVYDEVAAHYQDVLGFRAALGDGAITDNGGDGRFDVYLLNFSVGADGTFRVDTCPSDPEQCIGYVVQENDFVGFNYPDAVTATRILGSHEYFHGVQDAYDNAQGGVPAEGTAVWATEQYDPATTDFEGFIGGYLARVDRSIDSPPPGPVAAFTYGSAIFFQFLTEKYGRDLIRQLWERCVNGNGHPSEPADVADPYWVVQLDALLRANHASSFAQAFAEFATWNLYLGSAADPGRSYAKGNTYPQPAMSLVTVPYQSAGPLRVYYASTQYYRAAAQGRATMTAALLDDPSTPEDDVAGLVLVLAARQAGRNTAVLRPASVSAGTETVATAGTTDVITAVINTAREASGASQSRRPLLCIGTPDEVSACRAQTTDAGVGEPDGGTSVACTPQNCVGCCDSAGVCQTGDTLAVCGHAGVACMVCADYQECTRDGCLAPAGGCGCGMPGAASPLLLLAVLLLGARRRSP